MDVYGALRELLDKDPTGCPAAPEIDEILRILFTEEEARVALGMGFRPFPTAVIADRAGTSAEEAKRHLEAMADKGIVFAKAKAGEDRYALLPVMPGLFEFPFMKGEESERTRRLASLWKTYMEKLGRGFGSPAMAFSRVIPIQEQVVDKPGVLPFEKVYDMIDQARVVGIGHCACRETERACDAPREACMMFDDTCTFLVERGFGRYITKAEMKEKLRAFDARGLVHQVNNSRDRVTFICNCCRCCCELLRTLKAHGNPNVLTGSAFVPHVDPERCTGCAVCAEERCPMEAIEVVEGLAVVNTARCLGCGLCVSGCTEGAIRLERREGGPAPAATVREMNLTILREKGKLEGFLSMLTPDRDESAVDSG